MTTTIEIFGGCFAEHGDMILLAGRELTATGEVRNWSHRRAIQEAHQLIARRKLTDVAITARGEHVWADELATASMYPETGKMPSPRRDGGPGNVMALSAVRCPWDRRRHKLIMYA